MSSLRKRDDASRLTGGDRRLPWAIAQLEGAQTDLRHAPASAVPLYVREARRPTCHSSPASAVSLYVSGARSRPATAHQRRRFPHRPRGARADLPQLTSVGCYLLDVREARRPDLPQLASVGDLPLRQRARRPATAHQHWFPLRPQGAQADATAHQRRRFPRRQRGGAQADLPQLHQRRRFPRRPRGALGRPPRLTSVGCYLDDVARARRPTCHSSPASAVTSTSAGRADRPQLTSVGGYLDVRGRAGRPATAHQRRRFPRRPRGRAGRPATALTSVGGFTSYVSEGAQADRPASSPASAVTSTSARARRPTCRSSPASRLPLRPRWRRPTCHSSPSVGGYLYVRDGAQTDLPQLASVGGSSTSARRAGRPHQRRRFPLRPARGAQTDTCQLTSVGCYLDVSGRAKPTTAHQRRRLPRRRQRGARRPTCHSSPASAVTSTSARARRPTCQPHQRRRFPRTSAGATGRSATAHWRRRFTSTSRGARTDLPSSPASAVTSTSARARRPTCHSSPASAVPSTSAGAQADLPQLTSVGGFLDVREGRAGRPATAHQRRRLPLRQRGRAGRPAHQLASAVTSTSRGAQADLPQLTSVGGSLDVSEGAQADLPQLTSVGGSSTSTEGAQADLPQLTSVGCYLDVSEGAQACHSSPASAVTSTSAGRRPTCHSSPASAVPSTSARARDRPASSPASAVPSTSAGAQTDLPQLTSVGGYLYVSGRAGRPATARKRRRLPRRQRGARRPTCRSSPASAVPLRPRGRRGPTCQLTSVGGYPIASAAPGICASAKKSRAWCSEAPSRLDMRRWRRKRWMRLWHTASQDDQFCVADQGYDLENGSAQPARRATSCWA